MNEKNKVLLFLATEKGFTVLHQLLEKDYADNIGAVITFKEKNVEKSWHEDILELCKRNGIESFLWGNIKQDISNYVRRKNFSAAITVSWIYLLPLELNEYMEYNLIIFHDSLLPRYRGFSPTPSAIINGEDKIGLTALFADEGVDTGDIIEQVELKVTNEMYMKEIIHYLSLLYGEIICSIFEKLSKNVKLNAIKQDNSKATYSIWRDYNDCKINWNCSSTRIYNFIRAVGSPYPGAFTNYRDRKIIIKKSEIIADKIFEIRDAGKLWSIQNNCPEVICGNGMIRIIEAYYEDGSKVLFNILRCRLN